MHRKERQSVINVIYYFDHMSEHNKKDKVNEDDKTSKGRPDKKPDLRDYKSEDKDALVEEKLE
jgi:hypothetical protein